MKMKNRKGFTLIEIIVTLIFIGFMAVLAGMSLVAGVEAYFLTRSAADLSQRVELAFDRMKMELENLTGVTTAGAAGVSYTIQRGSYDNNQDRSLSLVGSQIRMINGTTAPAAGTGNLLIDNVSALQLNYYDDDDDLGGAGAWTTSNAIWDLYAIRVTLTLNRTDDAGGTNAFSTVIYNKRNGRYSGPYNWNAHE